MALQLIETWMVLNGSWIRMARNRVSPLVVERQPSSSAGGQGRHGLLVVDLGAILHSL